MKETLVQRELVTHTIKNRFIESIGFISYSPKTLEIFNRLFEELKDRGIIAPESTFNGRELKIRNKDSYGNFIFDLDMYPDLQQALRCWVLLKKSASLSTSFILGAFNKLKSAIFLTTAFKSDENTLASLDQYLSNLTPRVSKNMAEPLLEFLSFLNHSSFERYHEVCSPYIYRMVTVRELPPYKDILIFDDILNRFVNVCNEQEKLRFFPIVLWWKITRIIPMRPSEFCSIQRDCLSVAHGGKYFIIIPREKRKPRNSCEIELTDTLQINAETYLLIQEYIDLTSQFPPTPFLLSYMAYREFLRYSPDSKINPERFSLNQFSLLLDHFYSKVIIKKFHRSNLARITPGDTRHFAFCNMMLQGFNMLSIARMGGHHSLHSQMHYHGHLDHFAESYVYTLAQSHRMDRITFSNYDANFNFRELVTKGKLYDLSNFNEFHEVDYGYCTDHPARCEIGDCRFCKHFFIPRQDLQHAMKWLKDSSDSLGTRIKEQLNFIKRLVKDMVYNLKTLEYQYSAQENLSSAANELKRMLDQKSLVDSWMEDEQ